jgi:hypothetical protein
MYGYFGVSNEQWFTIYLQAKVQWLQGERRTRTSGPFRVKYGRKNKKQQKD